MFMRWISFLLLSMLSMLPLHAQAFDAPQRVWVISIGIGYYQQPDLKALPSAAAGAREVANALKDAWPEKTILYLTGDSAIESSPTKQEILSTIGNLKGKAGVRDRVVVYFYGQAMQRKNRLFLLPGDCSASEASLEETAIDVALLRQRLEALSCQERLLILDIGLRARLTGNPTPSEPMNQEGWADAGQWGPKASATLISCGEGERPAYHQDGMSTFSRAFIDGLHGKAIDPQTGAVTLASLLRYMRASMTAPDGTAAQHPSLLPDQAMTLRPNRAIAVAAFTGERADACTERVYRHLADTGVVQLIAREKVRQAQRVSPAEPLIPAQAQALGTAVGAAYVLTGHIRADDAAGPSFRVSLIDTESRQVVISLSLTQPAADWENACDVLASRLLDRLWESSICMRLTGALDVSLTPAADGDRIEVTYLGQTDPTGDQRDRLRPGKVLVAARRNALTVTRQAMVTAGETTRITIPMVFGSLNVTSNPAGAEILIGGVVRGTAPCIIGDLPQGPGTLILRKDGYEDLEVGFTIGTGREASQANGILPAKPCILEITSFPAGAAIYLNNSETAYETPAPCNITVPGGEGITVTGKLASRTTIKQEVKVQPGKTVRVTFDLPPLRSGIEIVTDPPGADVYVNDERVDSPSPVSFTELIPGTYRIRASLDEYGDVRQTVTIGENQQQTVTLAFPGRLVVQTDPPGASVYLNNELKGVATKAITLPLDPGEYQLRLTKEHYEPFEKTVEVRAGRETPEKIVLPPKPGRLTITSKPAGVTVNIVDRQLITPVANAIELAAGTYAVTAFCPEHELWHDDIQIRPDTDERLDIDMAIKLAELTVKSTPAGAAVSVNGEAKGATSNTGLTLRLPPGAYTVNLSLQNYQEKTVPVELQIDKPQTVNEILPPRMGRLRVTYSPRGAGVYINNQETPESSNALPLREQIVDVPAGRCGISVGGINGFQDSATRQITIVPDIEQHYHVDLQPSPHSAALLILCAVPYLNVSLGDYKKPGPMRSIDAAGLLLTGLPPEKPYLWISRGTEKPVRIKQIQLVGGTFETMDITGDLPSKFLPKKKGSLLINSALTADDWGQSAIIIDGRLRTADKGKVDDVEAGQRVVLIEHPHYERWEDRNVEVKSGRNPTPIIVLLQKRPGNLSVTTDPVGATVAIDAKPVGESPCTIPKVEAGNHMLEITKTGYVDHREPLALGPTEYRLLSITLQEAPKVVVTSEPAGADVLVNGKMQGQTPCTVYFSDESIRQQAGNLTILIRLPGYRIEGKSFVMVLGGKPQTFAGKLVKEPAAQETRKHPKDNAEMIWVPAGAFTMGSPDGVGGAAHQVFINGLWMYKYEVTVAQYRLFCQETGRKMPPLPRRTENDQPMFNINWADAQAYAAWAGSEYKRATGEGWSGRLPSEAEWEYAARGNTGQFFSWGTADKTIPDRCVKVTELIQDTSPFGIVGLGSNVAEWCGDWYDEAYYAGSPLLDPKGPSQGKERVVRGGAWRKYTDHYAFARISADPKLHVEYLGFRMILVPETVSGQ